MDSVIYKVIFCPEEDENRLYCEVCDKLCIERFYENLLKSSTHTNNFCKTFQMNFIKVNECNICY